MTRKGCAEGQRARSLTDWPIQSVCVAPEMRAGFLWEKGLLRRGFEHASRTGFHNSARVRNTLRAF